jgi:hypothetical protein|tara:strand:+ start:187 stop:438 length:252 start_codon:yes stop_codon:yes gene_type:complete
MFNVLRSLEEDLNKTISTIEDEWSDNPRNDYLFHQITGVQKAIDVVKQAQSKELLELDKWAQSEMRKELTFKDISPTGRTLSD